MPARQKIAFFILILSMMAVTNVFADIPQPNLLLNGDFETEEPVSWGYQGNGAFSLVNTNYVSNTHSVKTEVSSYGIGQWEQCVTGIDDSIKYRFRAHIYASNVAAGSHGAELHWFDANNSYLGRDVLVSTTASTWVEASEYEISPPAGAVKVWVVLRTYKVGTYYFDDIVLLRKDNNLHLIDGEFPIGLYHLTSLELLSNNNLEEKNVHNDLPASWVKNVGSGAAAQSWDSTNYASNTHSLKTQMLFAGQVDWRQLITNIDDSLNYNFNVYIYATNVAEGSHGAELHWFDASSSYLGRDVLTSTTASTWGEVSEYEIFPPAGAVKVWVVLRTYKVGTYYFDDISFEVDWNAIERHAEAKNAGFNFILTTDDLGAGDLKAAYDLAGVAYLPTGTYSTNLVNAVNSVEANSALTIWHGLDEPAWRNPIRTAEGVINAYNKILEMDDYYDSASHKVWLNHAPRGTQAAPSNYALLKDYSLGADIISMDIYPVPKVGNMHSNLDNRTISCVGDYVDILYNDVVSWDGIQQRPIWMILQGFSWSDLGSFNDSHAVELHWFDIYGNYLSRDKLASTTADTWFKVSKQDITPPAEADYVYVVLRTYQEGNYYFDDIILSENLLLNSDFEAGEPASWGYQGNGAFSLVNTNYVSNTHSVKTEVSSYGIGQWEQCVTGIDDSIKYRFRAHIYASNVAAGSHGAELHWFDANNSYLARDVLVSNTADKWLEVSEQDITPPVGAIKVWVVLRTYKMGTYYFDDVALIAGNLLPNGDFETEEPVSWGYQGNGAFSLVNTNYVSNTHSVKTEVSSYGIGQWEQKITGIDPNKKYDFSGWIYTDNVNQRPRPTWQQTRFMAYNAIIHGARGVVYWGNYRIPVLSNLWGDLKTIASELQSLSAILASPISFRKVTVSNSDIEVLLLNYGTGLYLIAANKAASAINNVTITISGLPLTTGEEFFEERLITISDNSFNDDFDGYQVHVYEIP